MDFKTTKRIAVAGTLSLSLMFSCIPTAAIAEPSDDIREQLSVVQAELSELYGEAEQVSEQLNDTKYELETTKGRIEENTELEKQKTKELKVAKRVLSQVINEDYKDGEFSLLTFILSSRSIDELVSNVYYANKVSTNRREAIETVKTITAELEKERKQLEEDKARQEELVTQQSELQAELEVKIAETSEYVDGLSVQLQEALAAEEAARQEAARKAAEEAARAAEEAARQEAEAAAAAAAAEAAQNAQNQGQNQDTGATNQNQTNTSTPTNNTNESSSGSGTGLPSGVANTIISAAIAQIGCAYQYGAASPGIAFDCSGLVSYAYGVAGYSVPHSSAALAAYCNKPVSQAEPGDILWAPGHVGIYIGGGVTVEAFNPSMGLGYGSTSYFVSAGHP